MMTRHTQRNAKFYLLGSASAFLMAAGAQAAYAADESAAAVANDDLALVEEAQIQTQVQQQQQQQQADEALELEEIVVTGSRIARGGFEDIFQPAVVVNSDEFEKRGFESIADALNELPSFGPGNDGFTTGSGQNVGAEFVDMFDLGTQRTLVVVNGRRFVPTNPLSADPTNRLEGSQVDLNNFASPLVERIENLSVGGAPLYGADAIAGTVNIVLKDDFEGLDLRFQYRNGFNVGNRDNYNVEGVFGANTADGRGNVAFAVQFEDQKGAVANDFPRLRNQASCFGNGANPCIIAKPEARFNILEGAFGFLPAPTAGVPFPTFASNVLQDEDGNILTFPGTGKLETFDPGNPIGTSAIVASGGSGFDNDDFNEAVVPVQRFVVQSLGHYDVSDYATFFYEANFVDSQANDLISQSGDAFNTSFLNTQGEGAFGVSIDNPFISADDRATLRGALDRAGLEDSNTVFLNGINLGLLPEAGNNFVEQTTFRLLGGVKGDFEFLSRNFNYEVSYSYGRTRDTRSDAVIRGGAFFNAVDSVALDEDSLAQLTSDDNLQALAESTANAATINVVRNGQVTAVAPREAQIGDIVCHAIVNAPGALDKDPNNPRGVVGITNPGNVPTPDPDVNGCTPVNPFAANGGSAEAVNFISSLALSTGKVQQTDFQAFLTGDLVDLPAGTLQVSVGAERRRDFGNLTTDGVFEDGLARRVPVASIPQKEIVSNEFFFETVIPVLDEDNDLGINDLVGFELLSGLDVNGSYRFVDTSNTSDSVNIYSAGGTMGFLDDQVTVRGNWTRSVRQPSIVELFAPDAQTFDQTGDPCDERNINQAQGTNRAQNCLAAARALGFDEAALEDLGGGNVALILAPGDDRFQTPSVNAAISLGSSGNPDLNFEVGNAFSVGFIYTPKFIPGLVLNADYISIEVTDLISEPDFSFFTQDCFDNSNFEAGDFRASCDNFFRSGPISPVDQTVISGFDIVTGNTEFQNQDVLKFEAIQGNLEYSFDVAEASEFFGFGPGTADLGRFRITGRFFAPIVFRNSAAGLPLQPDGRVANTVGQTTDPELVFTIDVNYTYGDFGFFWRSEYTDNAAPCAKRVPGDCSTIPDEARPITRSSIHNASLSYQISQELSFRGGVDNVLGGDQNLTQQAFGFGGSTLGRSYFLSLRYRQ